MADNKPEEKDDELCKLILCKRTYLDVIGFLMLEHPASEPLVKRAIPEKFVTDKVKEIHEAHLVGAAIVALTMQGYITIKPDETDPQRTMSIFIKEKGLIAAAKLEFYLEYEERKRILRLDTLTERSIKAHEHQKLINWALIIITALSIMSPIFVARYLEKDVVVPDHNIHIDSSALDSSFRYQLEKIISIQPQEPESIRLHPKEVVQ